MSNETMIQEYKNPKERVLQTRSLYPEAYALNTKEALRVNKIDNIIWQFFNTHSEFTLYTMRDNGIRSKEYIYNEQSIDLLKQTFKVRRVNLDNAVTLANRVLNKKWFQVFPTKANNSDAIKLAFTTNEGYIEIADKDKYPDLYEVWEQHKLAVQGLNNNSWGVLFELNPERLREALSLSDEYLYLSNEERESLELIIDIAEFNSIPFTKAQDGYLQMISTNQTTALSVIGSKALNDAVYDEYNESFGIVTTTGAKITYHGKELNLDDTGSVNMDKLLRHMIYRAIQDGLTSPIVNITLDDFKQVRGLRDNKEARSQLKKAVDLLYNSSIEINSNRGSISTRFIDTKAEIKNSSVILVFSNSYFNMLKNNKSIAQIPLSFFEIKSSQPNAYKIALFLADHKKRNIGNANENRVTIRKLLEVTSLPPADTIEPRRYKLQIIDPFFKALEVITATGELKYKIVHSNGVELTSYEKNNIEFDYDLFSHCLIDVEWLREPEYYTHLREDKRLKSVSNNNKRKDRAKG